LIAADAYGTRLEFDVPNGAAASLKLLISSTPGWLDHLVIGKREQLGCTRKPTWQSEME
jgi:hypothetical protein